MFDIFRSRLELSGTLTTVTAIRVGAGRSTEPTDPDVPVIKDALGRPLIPGASFKGALRSRLESFLRGIDPSFAIDPSELTDSFWMNRVKALKEENKNDEALTQALLQITDRVSKLFGSPWFAGKFQVRDLTVNPDSWFDQYQIRDGVSIDRDTDTALDGRKYDFQVVPAGVEFEFRAIIENADPSELGLLMIGLAQFENEMIPLRGGRSRGLGVVKLQLDEMIWIDPRDKPEMLHYFEHLVNDQLQTYVKTPDEIQALKKEWSLALISELKSATAPVVNATAS
jgi:CRISPR-associated RAMP protein (TIGR02581 family)